jgi:CDP-glucose 4,6-dehydratase
MWKNKNVLVTGGMGLVGGHLVERLVELEANVVVTKIINDPNSYFNCKKLGDNVIIADCDLKNEQQVKDVIIKCDIEIIFHLGAQALVPVAYHNPRETIETNIMGTVNILETVRNYSGVQAIVFASSDKAYGISDKLPYYETHELKGQHPYDVSKSAADLICTAYFKTYGVPVVTTRFGNIYGPGDLNFNRIVPGAIKSGLTGEPLEIRSDGKMIRDYVYVKDVVSGYLTLAENIEKTKGEAFNVSSGVTLNVLDMVTHISDVMIKEIKVNIVNNAKNEIPEQYLDYSKISDLLNWSPKYKLSDALKETIDWYKEVI